MNNKALIFIMIAGILVMYYFLKKVSVSDKEVNSNDFFNDLVKFTLKMEGGLSNDKTDTASKYPSPTPEKYHTNKGITYKTFVDSASLGYTPSVDNFLKMPDPIWLKIFVEKYYNRAKNFSSNVVLNGYLSLWYWGGWDVRLMPVSEVATVLASKDSAKDKLKKLVALRIEYFNNIVKHNASQKKYLKGWTDRANEFYTTFEKYV